MAPSFTEPRPDWRGEDGPSNELNHAPRPGRDFGSPYDNQGDALDPDFGEALVPRVARTRTRGRSPERAPGRRTSWTPRHPYGVKCNPSARPRKTAICPRVSGSSGQ